MILSFQVEDGVKTRFLPVFWQKPDKKQHIPIRKAHSGEVVAPLASDEVFCSSQQLLPAMACPDTWCMLAMVARHGILHNVLEKSKGWVAQRSGNSRSVNPRVVWARLVLLDFCWVNRVRAVNQAFVSQA